MRLGRTNQCEKCPWRVDVDPNDIPNGYCEMRHQNLSGTIAKPGVISFGRTIQAMACHESPIGKEQHCIGWLYNQLGEGNNIPLRIQMRHCENLKDMRIVGEQHSRFEDTLPENQ
jgi:Family of unknown function (DUF6283)